MKRGLRASVWTLLSAATFGAFSAEPLKQKNASSLNPIPFVCGEFTVRGQIRVKDQEYFLLTMAGAVNERRLKMVGPKLKVGKWAQNLDVEAKGWLKSMEAPLEFEVSDWSQRLIDPLSPMGDEGYVLRREAKCE